MRKKIDSIDMIAFKQNAKVVQIGKRCLTVKHVTCKWDAICDSLLTCSKVVKGKDKW